MLEPEATHVYGDLIGAIHRLRLARPALYALAKGPLRHVDLQMALVVDTGAPVHYRTLKHALDFLQQVDLITRHNHSKRTVVYTITQFGQNLVASMRATDGLVREHQGTAHTEGDPGRLST